MKKIFFITVILLSIVEAGMCQAPQAFKYQAVIRDTTGSVIADQLVSMKVSILAGDVNGQVVFSEIHDAWTNALGLINLEIGRGLAVEGDFAQISWGSDPHFIRLEIDFDGAMNYKLLGISQLLAVPYALYAEKSGSDTNVNESQWKDTDGGIYYNEGNVGINQSDPQYSMDISGIMNVSGDAKVSETFRVGTEKFLVGQSGYVGIGTGAPSSNLHIEGRSNGDEGRNFLLLKNNASDAFSCVYLQMNSGDGISRGYLTHHADNYSIYDIYGGTTCLWNSGNGLILRSNTGGRISFETTGANNRQPTELMRITTDGKIGVNTTTPEAIMQIEGESNGTQGRNFLWLKNNSTDDFSDVYLTLSSGDASNTTLHHRGDYYAYGDDWRQTALFWNHGRGIVFRTSSPGTMHFEFFDGTTLLETARFTGDGKVGIGTKEPQRSLHVKDVMRLEPRSTPPENPSEGDIYMDSSDHKLKVYDGASWQICW